MRHAGWLRCFAVSSFYLLCIRRRVPAPIQTRSGSGADGHQAGQSPARYFFRSVIAPIAFYLGLSLKTGLCVVLVSLMMNVPDTAGPTGAFYKQVARRRQM